MEKNILIEEGDKGYKPFPSFEEWGASTSVNEAKWEEYQNEISELRGKSEEVLKKALNVVTRAAAVDTGAIEGLYNVDRGITFTLAKEFLILSASAAEKYSEIKPYFDSQLKAYDMILDFTTKKVPITEAWIRDLHREITLPQKTYKTYAYVNDQLVEQQTELKHGQYKEQPNHVRLPDGSVHSYAPVIETAAEMQRFVSELNSDVFLMAHPVVQASYAHYAFVVIHPFSDGNGRVARALASIFTYRAMSVPFLILVEDKEEYYNCLALADRGNYEPFIMFTYNRVIDSIRLAIESFRVAAEKEPSEQFSELEELYSTKGGFTHPQIDDAGYELMRLIIEELQEKFNQLRGKGKGFINVHYNNYKEKYTTKSPNTRCPVKNNGLRTRITIISEPPADSKVDLDLIVEVPIDGDTEDEIIINNISYNVNFKAKLSELIPKASPSLKLRITFYAENLITKALRVLKQGAEAKLRSIGYKI